MKLPDPKRLFCRAFPILRWSKNYDSGTAVGDLIAGVTVALTLIPQSIAYAALAGLQPQYGLYASFVGGFVYAVMGTCPQINIGPTALLSLLTLTYTNGTSPDLAVLLCLISGIVQLIAGALQLGFLVEFVSLPVVSGFTSAAAITIASSQIKGLLGLKFHADTFIATWRELFRHIGDTRLTDTLLSLACCIVLLGMKALKDIPIGSKEDEKTRKGVSIIQKSLWFAGVSRNAVVVVLAAVIAFFVYLDVADPFILTGKITPGLPTPQVPPFHTIIGNETLSAGGMLAQLGSGLLVVPLVGIISNVAIAKAFSNGKTLDATQEIIALGACNVVGAFFRSFPVNGSFSRSAVSDASGVRSPAAGFYTGIIVLFTLAVLTPYFYFIPRAALSAVIVCAVLHMVDVDIIKRLWRSSRLDIIPLVGTFVCCLALGIEIGLICGVGVDVLLLLYYNSRPPLGVKYVEEENLPPHYAIHPVGNLHFAGAERVRSKLSALKSNTLHELRIVPGANDSALSNGVGGGASDAGRVLVIHCESLYRVDYTFLQSIKMLVAEWSRSGRVIWCDARPLLKDQLSAVLPEPVCCDTQQLAIALAGDDCKKRWKNVKDTYFRQKRKNKYATGSAAPKNTRSKFHTYANLLSFLETAPMERLTINNIENDVSTREETQMSEELNVSSDLHNEEQFENVMEMSQDQLGSLAKKSCTNTAPVTDASASNSQSSTVKFPMSTKRQKKNDILEYLKKIEESRQKALDKLSDDEELLSFSDHLKSVLKKLPPILRIKAKNELYGVLTKYE